MPSQKPFGQEIQTQTTLPPEAEAGRAPRETASTPLSLQQKFLRLAALFSPKPGPLTRECARSTVVVINRELPEGSPPEGFGPCLILDPAALKDSGPLAIWPAFMSGVASWANA